MFSRAYWKKLGERTIVVFSSTLGGILAAGGFGLLDAPWEASLSAAGMAALVAALLSVGGGVVTTSKGPEMTSEETEREMAT